MLQRQGLVLAGVTVGHAQTGDAGQQQQRRPRQEGARQGLVSSAEPVSGAQAHGASRTSGGAVDLFV
jgi:hypothetical protein